MWELFVAPEEAERFREIFEQLRAGRLPADYESAWAHRQGARRLIAWSSTVAARRDGAPGLYHRHRHRHHRSASAWSARSSKSAAGSSAGSGRTCTTAWASI